jgi:hypothetical protein
MEYMHDFPEIPYSFRLICNASEIRAYFRLRGGLGEPYMEYRGHATFEFILMPNNGCFTGGG